MMLFYFYLLFSLVVGENYSLTISWRNVTRISDTLTTLQVVSNPILNRKFTAPNGTVIENPIHDAAWASLKALNADKVRYVPWFPYPKRSVAELDAPTTTNTSWNFDDIHRFLYFS